MTSKIVSPIHARVVGQKEPMEFRGPDVKVRADNGGIKHDQEKDPWHLLPWDAIRAVTKVLAFGAHKYSERNWEKGMDWHRLFRAAINHLTAWFEGEAKDPETGYSHLWHATCCCLFLVAYELRGVGRDTRPVIEKDAA